ncbi:YbjP/YqhG family protein, partial [Escherichia coli]|nr:YbjP/YqhG family protein [Escherichia coli]
MKIILLFLAALASFTVHAQPPSQTVEQTVRHIYQNYKSDATAPYFGETGERAITSARIQQALTLNDNLTLPGNIGWLDYDPVCDCQDFGGFAPIFPDTCYHLTHYWPAAADIPVASD